MVVRARWRRGGGFWGGCRACHILSGCWVVTVVTRRLVRPACGGEKQTYPQTNQRSMPPSYNLEGRQFCSVTQGDARQTSQTREELRPPPFSRAGFGINTPNQSFPEHWKRLLTRHLAPFFYFKSILLRIPFIPSFFLSFLSPEHAHICRRLAAGIAAA